MNAEPIEKSLEPGVEMTCQDICNQGCIERIRHGFFKLSEADEPSEEEMLAKLLPQGIVCVEPALFCLQVHSTNTILSHTLIPLFREHYHTFMWLTFALRIV